MLTLPTYARLNRNLPPGEHPLSTLLPGILESPALTQIEPDESDRKRLVACARVLICGPEGFAFVDVEGQRIILSESYYSTGRDVDLYLDLIHELTHLRQLSQGFDLWDDRFDYVERPTEIEAYAVSIVEAQRFDMSEAEIRDYLTVPWLSDGEVDRLLEHVSGFLSGGRLPNLLRSLFGAPFIVQHPWRCAKPATARGSEPTQLMTT